MNTDNIVGIDVCEIRGLVKDLFDKLCGASGREWLSALKLFLQKQNPWPVVKNVLADMIAAGHYDWINPNIKEQFFSLEGLVLGVEPRLYKFDRDISSKDVIAAMYEEGYRPGNLADLLDFGVKNPEEQRKRPIVSLDSFPRNNDLRDSVCLDGDVGERRIILNSFDLEWGRDCRFLAVRK